jgi:hypothetical protein
VFNHPPEREPRASRIPVPGRPELITELWMGGADSLFGDRVQPEDLRDAWVIDLAGDMPEGHRTACALWLPRVFADIEGVPHAYARLTALAESIAAALTGGAGGAEWEHPEEPPARLYIMCQQGMNRSGLITGLVLRALGVAPEEALAAIASRPGALTNRTFAALIRSWPPTGSLEDGAVS